MIDTHCHLLPGLDDGPATDVDAIGLARHLVGEGIETILCTPHFSEEYPTRWTASEARLERLRSELLTVGIAVETALAAEVSPGMALEAPVEHLLERSIGERYLLVELVASTTDAGIDAIARRLASVGLDPILAHPERCLAVQRHPATLQRAIANGAVVQVVAPSLTGHWGESVWTAAWRFVETGQAHVLGSDAHRLGRAGGLDAAARLVRVRCGAAAVRRLTTDNPHQLLEGADCE